MAVTYRTFQFKLTLFWHSSIQVISSNWLLLRIQRSNHGTDMTKQLNLSEAVALAHSIVSHHARKHGVRVLFIKGPVAEHFGLRPHRLSSDVDALVDPMQLDALVTVLIDMGWYKRPLIDRPRILDQHSITLIHDNWPCDIDLHLQFPGFLEENQGVFEYLWSNREEAPVAGTMVPCPSMIHTAAIQALHSFRDFDSPRNVSEYHYMIQRLKELPLEMVSVELQSTATATKSAHTLEPLLDNFGIAPPRTDAQPENAYATALAEWKIRTTPQTNKQSVTTLVALLRPNSKNRFTLLMRSLIPSEQDIRQNHPAIPSGRSYYYLAVSQRLVRGIVYFPYASYVALRYRRTMTGDRTPVPNKSIRNK